MSSSSLAQSSRWPLLWLICLGLICSLTFQGTRALWNPDEGRYVDAALEMLDSGNYLAPAYSPDEVNFSKPPTTYWFIAASLKVFGRNAWAARIPYALAFLCTLLLLYAMGKRVTPEKPWLPALVYGCSVFPFFASNIMSTDAFLVLFEALAMFGFLSATFGDDARRKRYVLLMWLGWGLAFLTKGPPGLIPLLAIIPFIVSRDGWRGLGRLFSLSGIALFLLVGLSWYLVVVLSYPGLLHYFLHQEVYNRLFTNAHHRHAGLFGWIVVYVPTLALGSLPWWPSVFRGLRGALSSEKWKAWKSRHSVELFLGMWFLIPFVVFCLVQSRLPLYMLPLFLPISLMLALELRDRVDLSKTNQRVWLAVWIVVLLVLKGVGAYVAHPSVDNRVISQQLRAVTPPDTYTAVTFVQNTDQDYTIEEATPWGVRLYLNKTVYGIPLRSERSAEALCHALRAAGSTLVVVDPDLKSEDLQPALALCTPRRVVPLGSWRGSTLELIQI